MEETDIQVNFVYNLKSISSSRYKQPNPVFQGRVLAIGPCYVYPEGERRYVDADNCFIEITAYNISDRPQVGYQMRVSKERFLSVANNKESAKHVLTSFKEDN